MMQKRVCSLLAAACVAALVGCSRGTQDVSEPDPGPQAPPPAAGKRASCEAEIAIECPEGLSDGCGRQAADGGALTTYHICVPDDEEEAAPPCEQEIARACDEGLIDACLVQPPAAATHLCVQASPHPG